MPSVGNDREQIVALQKALGLALFYLIQLEPGDSRAVSDEFVAMASVLDGDASSQVMEVIVVALQRAEAVEHLKDSQ